MSMLEDFWLPRRDGSKGTEITTLPGGANLGDLGDVEYFKGKLYQALNVPISRINQDNNFQLGRASDISRDELKFTKFIHRIRKQFAELFNEVLRVQLVLKGVCTTGEFEEMRQYITYDYISDTHFENLKRIEILGDQLNVLRDASEYVGKYFSIEYIRKEVLGQTEEDIARIDQQIMDEMEKEQITDIDAPNDVANNDYVNMYDEYKRSPKLKLTEDSSDLDINIEAIEDSDAVTEQ